ncbi:MAG: 8-oxo-dGTP diphosphatase [Candidatus Thorarchaeota archaeon]|jgi:8-oxo-dGTP diphosphatase/2-hydroxy-dATP diphosphatase
MRTETVSIVYQPPRILLGMKKQRFGRGKYNGFGGEVEDGETLEESVVRETLEEAGITITDPELMGKILFQFKSDEQDHLVHFFRAMQYQGTIKESDEMKPEWFDINDIPYDEMWADDKYWLPLLLSNRKFEGNFQFNGDCQILDYKLNEVEIVG